MNVLRMYTWLVALINLMTEAQEGLRRDKLRSISETSTMSDDDANAIFESSHRVYDLSPADFAKMQLLFIKFKDETRGQMIARMVPLLYFQKGIDAEMDAMFPNEAREIG